MNRKVFIRVMVSATLLVAFAGVRSRAQSGPLSFSVSAGQSDYATVVANQAIFPITGSVSASGECTSLSSTIELRDADTQEVYDAAGLDFVGPASSASTPVMEFTTSLYGWQDVHLEFHTGEIDYTVDDDNGTY